MRSTWMVDICQVRPIASFTCTLIFGRVERGAAGVEHELEAGRLGGLAQRVGGPLPVLVAADRLLRVAGGELEVEVVEPVVAQQVEDELQQRADLALHLLVGAVDVRVVLGEAAGAGEAVDHPGLLVAVDGAELEQPQRQLPVRPAARPEDQVVHRAVHRLEVVVLPGLAQLPVGAVLGVELHGRVHALGVPGQVAGGLEQLGLGDVRGVDELVARLACDGGASSPPARGGRCRPWGGSTARPDPISSGNENRSSSAPRRRWSRRSASASRSRWASSASCDSQAVP